LAPWQRRGLVLFGVVVVLFGALFVFRSAFQNTRKGDLDVFLRAGWAVRAGEDIYTVTDDKGFHYHYPPFLAILLAPLADPSPGRPTAGIVPYPASVAVWYVLSLLCLALAVHRLAGALEGSAGVSGARPRFGSRAWWSLRVIPVLGCAPALGGTLMRGQVDTILLLLLCGMAAAALRGRSAWAGVLLAAAVSIKVIPAFLLVYPLWRRDGRWLAGCAAGLALFLGAVPAAVFGPGQAVAYYREWYEAVIRPGLTDGGDQTRADELTQVTATDSQSIMVVLNHTRHPERWHNPTTVEPGERLAHWAVGGLLTLLTLAAAGRRFRPDGPAAVLLLGALNVVMLLLSPVCHLHYFSLSMPLVLGLVAASGLPRGRVGRLRGAALWTLLAVNIVANALPRVPGQVAVRQLGLAGYGALLLWAVGCVVVWRSSRRPAFAEPRELPQQPPLAA
jgi:hypothetical protein